MTQSDGEKSRAPRNTVAFTDFTGRVRGQGQDRPPADDQRALLPWIIGGAGSLVVIDSSRWQSLYDCQRSSPPQPGPHLQASPVPGPASQVFHPNHRHLQQFPAQSTLIILKNCAAVPAILGQTVAAQRYPDGTGDSTYPRSYAGASAAHTARVAPTAAAPVTA